MPVRADAAIDLTQEQCTELERIARSRRTLQALAQRVRIVLMTSAWSARARPGLGVSVPIAWNELSKVMSGAHWNVRNIHTRLDKANEPWSNYSASAHSLDGAMRVLGFRG
jgi:DNA primase